MSKRDLSVVFLAERPKPPGLIRATLRVVRLSPFHVLRRRRLIALSLLVAIPPLIVLILRILGQRDALSATAFKEVFDTLNVNVIFPLVALFVGAAALGDDVDDGTVLYMRLRPIPRSAMVIGRYFAAWGSCCLLFVPPIVLQYLIQIGGSGGEHLWSYRSLLYGTILAAAFSGMAFSALFQLLGVLSRRAVLFGIILIAVQPLLVKLGGPLSWVSIQLHIVNVLAEFSAEADGRVSQLEALDEVGLLPTLQDSVVGIAIASCVFVLAACVLFSTREYSDKQGE